MTIKITLQDDNKTNAPLYAKYDGQLQAQNAYIEIDLDESLQALDVAAYYSGNIGGDGVLLSKHLKRFRVPSNVSREALMGLSEDKHFAKRLKDLFDAYEKDDGEEVSFAEYYIDNYCSMLETVDVWEAKDWVSEGFDLDEYEANPEKYVTEAIQAAESEGVAIDGDIGDACEELAEEAREELED